MLKQFENCMSLGNGCWLSNFMLRTGLSSFYNPFSWITSTNFEAVLKIIDENFAGFLDKSNLHFGNNYECYDEKYDMIFYHDFCKEYSDVKEKYDRRIKRFLDAEKKPTCFFRIVIYEKEVDYINNNQKYIQKVIKKYNQDNEIVFLVCKKDVKKKIEDSATFYFENSYVDFGWFQNKDHSYKMLDNKEFCEFIKNILPKETMKKNMDFYVMHYNCNLGPFLGCKYE